VGYIPIKGGTAAIREAARAMEFLRTQGAAKGEQPIQLDQVEHQLHFLHGLVLSEGALYDPELASLAIKQSMGDALEASFMLRAFRSTRSRVGSTPPLDTSKMRLIRRISASFNDVPGGQTLGPTPDYSHRLLNLELIDEPESAFKRIFSDWMADVDPTERYDTLPKVTDYLRSEGLLRPARPTEVEPFDITRKPIKFPLPRSGALSILSRGHQGSLLAIAYTTMRGFGGSHPNVAEMRVGYLPVEMPHPITGEPIEVGEVLMTECEIVSGTKSTDELGLPQFTLGYGACFGHNEVKAICMAMLDRSIQNGNNRGAQHPAESQEFVCSHVDGIDSMGFCIHYKMPHYVTFQAGLDRLRTTRQTVKEGGVKKVVVEAAEVTS
jgi:alpha-D-ribose 1-methylphosphonate 5-triphosphate synthase subunit PhnI